MSITLKQVVAIDCSKEKLDCTYGKLDSDLNPHIQTPTVFSNEPSGFKKLVEWAEKRIDQAVDVRFLVEATGVYHERLANFLADNGYEVSVILPSRISSFFRTTGIKTINDPASAKMIALFGLEKKVEVWKKPHPVFNSLRQLIRERNQLVDQRTVAKNQLHAEESSAYSNSSSLKRGQKLIKFINQQIKEIETEVNSIVAGNAELKCRLENLCTIKGVGMQTAVTVVAELNGFELIRNKKQLVSYAGLDVVEKQSGSSVHKPTRISKRGNKHLRKALHYPALTAIRHDPTMKNHYANLISKHGIKMKAAVSVQRKLLVLIYTLWKTNKPYNPNHKNESGRQLLATPTELDQVCSE